MKQKKIKFPTPEERPALLNEQRNLKMAASAHAYMRGNTIKFYEWLEERTSKSIPHGPGVWICGDCHVGNLGPIHNAAGGIDIQIRDLDQAVIGNPAYDLIRLGLSLATAARGADLPGVTTVKMLEQIMDGYEQAFEALEDNSDEGMKKPKSIQAAIKAALRGSGKQSVGELIKGTALQIPLGKGFWPISSEERKEITNLFKKEAVRQLVVSLKEHEENAELTVLDAAYWRKGCSSLGKLRYAALLSVGKKKDLCLIDVKEAVTPIAPSYSHAKMPQDNGKRVKTGAMHLAPFLGNRMHNTKLLNKSVFLRELLPQDLKLDIECLTQEESMNAAHFLAMAVGNAHARQMDEASRTRWRKELKTNRTKSLDAPSWLWTSIVELMVRHEAGYLEHCRRYAMGVKTT